MREIPTGDIGFSISQEHYGYTFMVRLNKSSILCIHHGRQIQPFRQLLKPGTPFVWNENLETLLQESKVVIINEIEHGVQIFDKRRPTCLATDWSKTGIGFWLFQKHCSCSKTQPFCCNDGWKVTLVGSRFTHGAESRYAPVEGEALAVVDALVKSRYFVLGCDYLTIVVDHKPLLKLFGYISLESSLSLSLLFRA